MGSFKIYPGGVGMDMVIELVMKKNGVSRFRYV